MTDTTYENEYNKHIDIIRPNFRRYEPFSEEIEQAIQIHDTIGNEHIWSGENDTSTTYKQSSLHNITDPNTLDMNQRNEPHNQNITH